MPLSYLSALKAEQIKAQKRGTTLINLKRQRLRELEGSPPANLREAEQLKLDIRVLEAFEDATIPSWAPVPREEARPCLIEDRQQPGEEIIPGAFIDPEIRKVWRVVMAAERGSSLYEAYRAVLDAVLYSKFSAHVPPGARVALRQGELVVYSNPAGLRPSRAVL